MNNINKTPKLLHTFLDGTVKEMENSTPTKAMRSLKLSQTTWSLSKNASAAGLWE